MPSMACICVLLRRVYEAAWKKVNEYGCLVLQFPTFTYMRVGWFDDHPYMLTRYPTDKIILIELGRQMMVVHAKQLAAHKATPKILMSLEGIR